MNTGVIFLFFLNSVLCCHVVNGDISGNWYKTISKLFQNFFATVSFGCAGCLTRTFVFTVVATSVMQPRSVTAVSKYFCLCCVYNLHHHHMFYYLFDCICLCADTVLRRITINDNRTYTEMKSRKNQTKIYASVIKVSRINTLSGCR